MVSRKTLFSKFTALYVLHFLDLIFTLFFTNLGISEANPILQYFLSLNVFAFIFTKILLGWGGTYILYKNKNKKYVGAIVNFLCFGYCLIMLWHFYGFLIINGF